MLYFLCKVEARKMGQMNNMKKKNYLFVSSPLCEPVINVSYFIRDIKNHNLYFQKKM